MKEKQLKDYSIKTKVIIEEIRERYKKGNVVEQPFKMYCVTITNDSGMTMMGNIKNKRELFKKLKEELRWI